MEVELGLKVTTQPKNLTFATSETDAAIVILGHLPGIRQEDIDISVNDEGTAITISGRGNRFLSHAVTSGRRLRLSNEVETQPFRKVFRIPNVIFLDQINAGFDEEGSILMVLMPKRIRGESSLSEAEEEPIQDRIQSDEQIPSCQEHPSESETSKVGRDGEEEPIQDRIQSDEEISSLQEHPSESKTSEAGRDDKEEPIQDRIQSDEEISSCQRHPPEPETSKAGRDDEEEPIQDRIQSHEEISSRQRHPLEPETSEASRDADLKTSEQQSPLIEATNQIIEHNDCKNDRAPQYHQPSTCLNPQDDIEKQENKLDPPRSSSTKSIGTLDLDGSQPPVDALEPDLGAEQEESIKEADLNVRTPEGTAPKQDHLGKVEGEANTPKSNMTPGNPLEQQEIEKEEPLKEADHDVYTPEATAPKQDQSRKVEGEANAPKPNVTSGIPQSEHHETKKEEPFKEADLDFHTPEAIAPNQDQSRKVEGEANTPKPNVMMNIPRSEHQEAEKEKPIEEADLDVHTPEASAPKQDQSGNVGGEVNIAEPNVTPGIPRPVHQEGRGGEISPEKSADRMPTMEMTAKSDDVVAEGHQQVMDTGNEEEENDDETGSEASSKEQRNDGDGQPKEKKNGKKGRVRRRARKWQASSRLPPLLHLVGSAFIFSLVALITHYVRNRRRGS